MTRLTAGALATRLTAVIYSPDVTGQCLQDSWCCEQNVFNLCWIKSLFCSLAPSENRSKGSLLCFAQFMEREIARKKQKQNWVEIGNAFNYYTNKEI